MVGHRFSGGPNIGTPVRMKQLQFHKKNAKLNTKNYSKKRFKIPHKILIPVKKLFHKASIIYIIKNNLIFKTLKLNMDIELDKYRISKYQLCSKN